MKRQIDPNLDNLSNDILKEMSNEVDDKSTQDISSKGKATSIDPQLNLNIVDVLNETNDENKAVEIPVVETSVKDENEDDRSQYIVNSQPHHEHHHSDHHGEHHHHSGHHHHHSHHHHEEKKKKSFGAILLRVILAIIAIILIIALVAGSTFLILKKKGENDIKSAQKVVTQDNEYNETIQYNGKNYVYDSDVITFAFLGVDQRKFQTSEQTDYVGSADTDLVMAINTKDGKVDIIAIPRDTMVDIDVYNNDGQFLHAENMQLCLAYRFGNGGHKSSENVTKAMSRILNVPVEKYFTLDLNGIGPLNDAIGGVTLESQFDFQKGYGLDIHVGDELNLTGEMAEMYVRARDDDNVNASLGRTQRQIQYIKAYAKRLIPAVTEDFSTISRLYNTAQQYSQTNISLENITYIASILLSKNITEFDTHTLAGTMKPAPVIMKEEDIYAQFIVDEEKKTELVLDVFYDEVG